MSDPIQPSAAIWDILFSKHAAICRMAVSRILLPVVKPYWKKPQMSDMALFFTGVISAEVF